MADLKTIFSVAAVFSDHMVLQRNKYTSIFGKAENGTLIKAALFDEKNEALCINSTVAENGHWLLQLEPQSAQTGCSIIITAGENKIKFNDIYQIAELNNIDIIL